MAPWNWGAKAPAKGLKIVEGMTGHAIDGESAKHCRHVKLDEESIFEPLRVRVGVYYLAEEIVGALRLWVVCVRHRVNKPSLSVYPWWSGWRLATSHGKRAGFPAWSRWSAEGRYLDSLTLRALSGWGACYPEKKARRLAECFRLRDL